MDEVTELSENNAVDAAEATEEVTEDTTTAVETTVADEAAPQGEAEASAETPAETVAEAVAETVPEEEPSTPAPVSTRDADGFSNALPTLENEDSPRQHVVGGVGYEIIYVVRTGDQKVLEETGKRVRDLIEKHDGAIDNVRASEVRRFAYPIKKQTEGVYVVINARFKPEHTNEMDRFFKLEESVLRHMMLKEDN